MAGTAVIDLGATDVVYGLSLQSSGKIVLAGVTAGKFAVVRLNIDGTLDPSFSGDGIEITQLSTSIVPYSMLVQPDDRIVLSGAYIDYPNDQFITVRYNVDGGIDPNFGSLGRVITDLGINDSDQGQAVARQADGKLLVAGISFQSFTGEDFALVRYKSDGTLDETFSGDGRLTLDFGGVDRARVVTVQADGKVIAAGEVDSDFGLARFNSDGTLDPSFGVGGKVTTAFGPTVKVHAITIQGDGKILVVGNTTSDIAIARYNSDGSLDTSFDTDGKVTTDFGLGRREFGYSVSLLSDGKILVGGYSEAAGDADFILARYNSTGALDTSFDGDGRVVTDLGSLDRAFAMFVQSDGKIILGGTSAGDFAIARYNADGSLDVNGTAGNSRPSVISAQSVTTNEEVSKAITISATDPDGDTLTYTVTKQASQGAVINNGGGNLTYTPKVNFSGEDSFIVTVSDGKGGSSTQTVTITVNPVNDAPTMDVNPSLSVNEDGVGTVTVYGKDVDGDVLTYAVATAASHGTVSGGEGGVFYYTPSLNYSGSDSFSLLVRDQAGLTEIKTITVTVQPVNDAPLFALASQSLTLSEDTQQELVLLATDAENDPISYTASTPANGIVAVSGTKLTYTPNPNYSGADSFVVTASDGKGGTSTQTVTVTVTAVNDSPTFLNGLGQRFSSVIATPGIAEDGTAIVGLSGQDVDGDALTYTISSAPANGSAVISGGNVTYSPTSNYNGSDSFVVTASDGKGGTATLTVNVSVSAVNDAPTFLNGLGQRFSSVIATPDIQEDGTAIVGLSGQDVDGDALTYAISSAPANGTAVISGGNVTYSPASNYNGSDSFVVTASDGKGGTATMTVNVSVAAVNDAPVFSSSSLSVAAAQDTLTTITALASDVDGDTITYSASSPSKGSVSVSGSTISFTPQSGFTGTDSFTITASDGKGGTGTQIVNVRVAALNDTFASVSGDGGANTLAGAGSTRPSSITGGAGNDTITGTTRADIVALSGNKSDYTVTTASGVITVVDKRAGSPDGTDTIRGLNILKFADAQQFINAAANRLTLAGSPQVFNVASSDLVNGTNAVETFIVSPRTSALILAGNNDVVELAGAINNYSYKASGSLLQISDGTYTTTLNIGGTVNLRTASGSTTVAIDFAAGGAMKLGGSQIVGSAGFDPLAAITNAANKSTSPAALSNVTPTVTQLTTIDRTPTLTGTATIGFGQSLQVVVNGVTYSEANGVVLGPNNTWSLTLPTMQTGTYNVTASLISAAAGGYSVVSGSSAAETLSGAGTGKPSVITGGAGNDTITGTTRADVAVFSGNKSDYTVSSASGVITVVDNRAGSPDGTDTIRGLNILKFADTQQFVNAAANRLTLAGSAQTYTVANSDLVNGTNAVETFIVNSRTSPLILAGNNDIVELPGAINSYTYKASGSLLQMSDGVYTVTLNVSGTVNLRTASGATTVAIDFAAGGAMKLGGSQIVGSAGFDPLAAIANASLKSSNAAAAPVVDTTSNELVIAAVTLSASGNTADEGKSFSVSVGAPNVADGTIIPYSLTGSAITAADFEGGLSGTVTITGGTGTITLKPLLDRLTEGDEAVSLALGGDASGNAAFNFTINDIGLSPVTVLNNQSYTATVGKVDTFVVDTATVQAATISGFSAGDVIELQNRTSAGGINFEDQTSFTDNKVDLVAGTAIITLLSLGSGDSFNDEATFKLAYGPNAIIYLG